MLTKEKGTTALDTSVDTDDRQSAPLNFKESSTISDPETDPQGDNSEKTLDYALKQLQRMNDPHYLHTVSMTELYQTTYKSRPPIIEGLLYAGAYILAGAPKIGKSFLVAQIAYYVSTGEKLWEYDVHPGTVLYLALEDDYQRIQSRMFMMYGVEDTERLRFGTVVKKIGKGLLLNASRRSWIASFSSGRDRNRWFRRAARMKVEIMPAVPSTAALSLGERALAGRIAVL